jgi:hypothetical protein
VKLKETYQRVKDLLSPGAASQVTEEDVALSCPGCEGPLQYRGRVDGLDVAECPGCHLPIVMAGVPLNAAAHAAEEAQAREEVDAELKEIERAKSDLRPDTPPAVEAVSSSKGKGNKRKGRA